MSILAALIHRCSRADDPASNVQRLSTHSSLIHQRNPCLWHRV